MKYPRYIYAINVNGRGHYIGIACNVDKRVYEHLHGYDELSKEMKKYGYWYKVIDTVHDKNEEIMEYVRINQALDLGLYLYNNNTMRKEWCDWRKENERD